MGVARRVGEGAVALGGHVERGVERVPLEVVGQRHLPVLQDVAEIGAREVELLLLIGVLGLDQLGVLILVVGVVGGVLGVEQRAEPLRPAVGQRALDERVGVPQPFAVAEDVVDNGSRDAALGVVGVGSHGPLSVGHLSVEPGLHAGGVYVAVLPVGCRVVGDLAQRVAAAVAEFVPAGGVGPLAAERRADGVGDLVLVAHRGVDEPERAGLHRGLEIGPLALLEAGAPRGYVDRSGGSEILGRLENVAFLTVVERYFLHVVQREASQIDLSVLGVAQLDAVVEHGHVVGAHRADVDGFQTAHAAVVFELHAREIADGVGHRKTVQPLQVDVFEDLRRDDLAVFGDDGSADDDDLADFLDAVQFSDVAPVRGGVGGVGRRVITPPRNECEA